ncbi:MAG: hypothetical protein HY721_24015, partial [Planctomycetes bacterium]|nr:hypothetical protein [Planctomycetota bacterium]
LPQTPEALRSYDAVVLFDPDQKVLTPAFLEALKGFVLEQGGGLAYVAGEYNARAVFESPALAALRALLPVEGIGPAGASGGGAAHGAASAQAASVHAYTRPWRPVLTPQGADHPVLRLKDEAEESARAWSALPPLYFNVPARGLKPAASALLEKDGDVVAAAGRAGAGYVVFLGTDETWRWRAAGREVPERFWAALVRYIAAGKRIAGTGEATLHADRDRYTAGEDVALEASLTDPERKPVVQERVEVAVETGEDGAVPVRLNLLPLAGRPGWYGARYRPEAPGHFTAQVAAGGQFSSAKASFVVAVPSTELSDPSPDLEALEDAARRTGGRIYTLAETGRVPENIGDRSVREVIGRSAATVWDSPALMLLFGALLTVEWILRKLWRLN